MFPFVTQSPNGGLLRVIVLLSCEISEKQVVRYSMGAIKAFPLVSVNINLIIRAQKFLMKV